MHDAFGVCTHDARDGRAGGRAGARHTCELDAGAHESEGRDRGGEGVGWENRVGWSGGAGAGAGGRGVVERGAIESSETRGRCDRDGREERKGERERGREGERERGRAGCAHVHARMFKHARIFTHACTHGRDGRT